MIKFPDFGPKPAPAAEPGPFGRIVHPFLEMLAFLNRPDDAIKAWIKQMTLDRPEAAGKAFVKGLKGEAPTSWSDILKAAGVEAGAGRTAAGLAGDIGLSVMWLLPGVGQMTKLGRAAKVASTLPALPGAIAKVVEPMMIGSTAAEKLTLAGRVERMIPQSLRLLERAEKASAASPLAGGIAAEAAIKRANLVGAELIVPHLRRAAAIQTELGAAADWGATWIEQALKGQRALLTTPKIPFISEGGTAIVRGAPAMRGATWLSKAAQETPIMGDMLRWIGKNIRGVPQGQMSQLMRAYLPSRNLAAQIQREMDATGSAVQSLKGWEKGKTEFEKALSSMIGENPGVWLKNPRGALAELLKKIRAAAPDAPKLDIPDWVGTGAQGEKLADIASHAAHSRFAADFEARIRREVGMAVFAPERAAVPSAAPSALAATSNIPRKIISDNDMTSLIATIPDDGSDAVAHIVDTVRQRGREMTSDQVGAFFDAFKAKHPGYTVTGRALMWTESDWYNPGLDYLAALGLRAGDANDRRMAVGWARTASHWFNVSGDTKSASDALGIIGEKLSQKGIGAAVFKGQPGGPTAWMPHAWVPEIKEFMAALKSGGAFDLPAGGKSLKEQARVFREPYIVDLYLKARPEIEKMFGLTPGALAKVAPETAIGRWVEKLRKNPEAMISLNTDEVIATHAARTAEKIAQTRLVTDTLAVARAERRRMGKIAEVHIGTGTAPKGGVMVPEGKLAEFRRKLLPSEDVVMLDEKTGRLVPMEESAAIGRKGVIVDRGVADYVNERIPRTPEEIQGVLGVYDRMQNWWKSYTLLPFAAYHIRNFFSNKLNMIMERGWSAKGTKLAMNLMYTARFHPENLKRIPIRLGEYKGNGAQYLRETKALGVIGPGFFATETREAGRAAVAATSYIPGSRTFFGLRWGRKAGEVIEDLDRLTHYVTRMMRGDSALAARDSMAKALFNYMDVTRFEREGLRRLIPFYTWCVPGDCEILTRDGWRYHNQLTVGQEVLTYAIERDEWEWQPLRAVHVFPDYNGELMRFKNSKPGHEFLFTPGHNWVISDNLNRRRLIQGFEFRSNYRLIQVAGKPIATSESILSAHDGAILGWIVTDGYSRWRGNCLEAVIYQSPSKHLAEIERLLGDEGHRNKPHPVTGVVGIGVRASVMHRLTKCFKTKADMPGIVTRLSTEAMAAMWEAMMKAEGHIPPDRPRQAHFAQDHGPVLDAFQILCELLGKPANIGPRGAYIKFRRLLKTTHAIDTVDFAGTVWCPETDNGTWLMRHKGAAVITGNSRKNIPYQVGKLAESPGYALAIHRVGRGMVAPEQKVDERYIPTYVKDNWGVQVSGTGEAAKFLMLGNWLPMADLLKLDSPRSFKDYVIGALSPILRVPIENALNWNAFFKDRIEKYPGQKEVFAGVQVSSGAAHLLRNIRLLSEADALVRWWVKRKVGEGGVSPLTRQLGLPATYLHKGEQARVTYILRLRDLRTALMKDLRQAVTRKQMARARQLVARIKEVDAALETEGRLPKPKGLAPKELMAAASA